MLRKFLSFRGGGECILSDWPGFLKVDIFYLGICLEFHLSDLVEHFSGVVGPGGSSSCLCWRQMGWKGGGMESYIMLKCALESHTFCCNFQAFSLCLLVTAAGGGSGSRREGASAYVNSVSQSALEEEQTILFKAFSMEPISGLNTFRLCYDFHGAMSVFLLRSASPSVPQ